MFNATHKHQMHKLHDEWSRRRRRRRKNYTLSHSLAGTGSSDMAEEKPTIAMRCVRACVNSMCNAVYLNRETLIHMNYLWN